MKNKGHFKTDKVFLFEYVVAVICLVLLQGFLFASLTRWQGGYLHDADSMNWLVRVQHLWDTGQWFNSVNTRINAPFGFVSHWTRPLDTLVLLFAMPLMPLLGAKSAIYVASLSHVPMLYLLVCLTVGKTASFFAHRGKYIRLFTMLIFILSLHSFIRIYRVGNMDHHALQQLFFAGSIYYIVRSYFREDTKIRSAAYAGALLGLGVWVNLEVLPVCLASALWFCGRWVASGDRIEGKATTVFLTGLAGIFCLALLVNPPAHAWNDPTLSWKAAVYDRLSIVHLTGVVAVLIGWLGITTLSKSRRGGGTLSMATRGCKLCRCFRGRISDVACVSCFF